MHVYEVRPRKDHRGVDLISDVLPFGALWYGEPNAISNAVGYAKFYSRSHDAVMHVCGDAGKVILQKPSIQPRGIQESFIVMNRENNTRIGKISEAVVC